MLRLALQTTGLWTLLDGAVRPASNAALLLPYGCPCDLQQNIHALLTLVPECWNAILCDVHAQGGSDNRRTYAAAYIGSADVIDASGYPPITVDYP